MANRRTLAVYAFSVAAHGALWALLSDIERRPPALPTPISIVVTEPEPPPPPEPEKKEPEKEPEPDKEPEPEPAPEPPKPVKQRPAPTPPPAAEAAPPSDAPAATGQDFGLELGNGGSGPGGIAVPVARPAATKPVAPVAKKTKVLGAEPKAAEKPKDECTEAIGKPKPIDIPQPEYSEDARAAGVEGAVRLKIAIDEKGNVSSVQVVNSLHPQLDRAAERAMQTARFEPAQRCGKPAPTSITISVRFTL